MLLLIFLLSFNVFANEQVEHFPGGDIQMNGMTLADYAGFEKKWEMVTIRYREDSGEMRITYGNDIAVKALKEGKTDYPDGAVFSKIAIASLPDPLFISSKVPSGARRFQYMLRDKKKFAETGGWGFALFDSTGKTFSGAPAKNSAACFSCHIAAEERGHVFSQMASFNSEVAANPVIFSSNAISSFEILKISDKSISDFKKIKQLSKFKEISVYIGPAKQNIFHGSVDEMIPSLIKEAKEKSIPAFFGNKNDKDYSFVIPTKKICETDKKIFQVYKYGWIPSKKGSNVGSYVLNPVERCL